MTDEMIIDYYKKGYTVDYISKAYHKYKNRTVDYMLVKQYMIGKYQHIWRVLERTRSPFAGDYFPFSR